jgi:CubicO group peptidase (beta-lactamase class C family)
VAYFLTWYFIRLGLIHHTWTNSLMGLASFGVGTFIVVDRFLQSHQRPVPSGSLASWIEDSLRQVNHQIWLLKNVFWWYLFPFGATLGFFVVASGWHSRHEARQLLGWGGYALGCALLFAFIYKLNQSAVRKQLEPRKLELETLMSEIGNPERPLQMKNTMRKLTIFITLMSVAFLALVVYSVSHPRSRKAIDGESLESIRKNHNLPALSVIAMKDGQICDQSALGLRKQGDTTPVTTNDLFHIGSCSKSMTATLAGILIDEGKLRWNTTIIEVFPELKGKMNPQYESVTLEKLLQHRGGVPGRPPSAAWTRAWEEKGTPTEQRREFIEAVLAQAPEAAPGTKMIYSNQGYAIVGAMLEKITKRDYESLITEKLFKPLHMDSVGFGVPGTKGQVDQPWGHIQNVFMSTPVQSDNPPAITPAGRVHCSLNDLAKFAMLHLQRGTNSLLKNETMAKLHSLPQGVADSNTGESYACGWVVLERGWAGGTALMHNGSNTMWYIVMWLAPEKNFAVIAATNIAGSDAEQGCDAAAVAMIHKWLPK